MATIAYKYALGLPLDWGDDIDAQLRLQNDLWNKLVEIFRANRDAIRAVAATDETVAKLSGQIETEKAAIERLLAERNARRRRDRAKTATPELDAEIKRHKASIKTLASDYKIARTAAYEAARPKLKALADSHYRAVTEARQAAAKAGLWWGNYNATCESYENARQKAIKAGADLRFRRYMGEGRLTNQIQGGMAVSDLFNGHSQVAVIDAMPDAECRCKPEKPDACCTPCKRRYHLEITAFTADRKPRKVRFPLIMHRRLPETGRIQMVSVSRRREFDKWRHYVVFNLRVADAQPSTSDGLAVVNLGWRKIDEDIRVATILRNGQTDFILLPHRLIAGHDAGRRNRGRMDDDLNGMQGAWLTQLDTEQAPVSVQKIVGAIRAAKRVRGSHLEYLRRIWETDCPKWRPVDLKELQEFGKRWRLFKRLDAAGRQWLLDARLDHYRNEVVRLLGDAGVVVINMHDMAQTARAEDSELHASARHQRVIAAPSLLRSVITMHAAKSGAKVVSYRISHDRCACHGVRFTQNDNSNLLWTCPVSHLALDQDEDYCRLMFQEYTTEQGTETAADQEAKRTPRSRANRKRMANMEVA